METVQGAFPDVKLPVELHDMIHTEKQSLCKELETTTKQLDQIREDFEKYKKKTRAATLKLQQSVASFKNAQNDQHIHDQIKALETEKEGMIHQIEDLQSQVDHLETLQENTSIYS